MSWKDSPAVVTITIGLAALGAGWTIGYAVRGERVAALETKISTLELSQKLELPITIESLRGANEQLKANLRVFAEADVLKEEKRRVVASLDEAQKQIEALKVKSAAQEADLQKKRAQLEEFFVDSQSFELGLRESRSLLAYNVSIGLTSLSSTTAEVMFNDQSKLLKVGESFRATVINREYRLILDSFDYARDRARFTLVVIK